MEHQNLPSETQDSFQDPVYNKEWARLQSEQHPDDHLQKIHEKKMASADPQNSLPFIPEKVQEAQDKAVGEESYLKRMAQKHKKEIEAITERARWKQAERQTHEDDLRCLKRKVDYTTPLLQPQVYYDTLHKIYSNKPPFNYDGDNPYEYDYVTPWDYHKTGVLTDFYHDKGAYQDAVRKEILKNAIHVDARYEKEFQFAGVPGKNPYVMPKYTQNQLLNKGPRIESSVTQKPVAQSSYTYSYSPDQVNSVKTLDTNMYDTKELSRSLPSMFNTKKPSPPATPNVSAKRRGVTIAPKAQVATGGGDAPLFVSEMATANFSPYKTPNLYDPAYLDPNFNPYVDSRHANPDGTRDTRFDWFPGSPKGPRPQTNLLKLQNSFTETDTREEFHNRFSEKSPDLRENINYGKKHDFMGLNACEMHWFFSNAVEAGLWRKLWYLLQRENQISEYVVVFSAVLYHFRNILMILNAHVRTL